MATFSGDDGQISSLHRHDDPQHCSAACLPPQRAPHSVGSQPEFTLVTWDHWAMAGLASHVCADPALPPLGGGVGAGWAGLHTRLCLVTLVAVYCRGAGRHQAAQPGARRPQPTQLTVTPGPAHCAHTSTTTTTTIMTQVQGSNLLDVLKKKMRQTKEEMEKYKEESEDMARKLQVEITRREEVSAQCPGSAGTAT